MACRQVLIGSAVALVCQSLAFGEVKPAGIFTDHAVLQRDIALPVWGTADANENVTVEFAGQTRQAVAGEDGKWEVRLEPLAASTEPQTLTIRGNNVVTLRDILVGDVWVCSGQSNMEWRMGNLPGHQREAEEKVDNREHPLIRQFAVSRNVAYTPVKDVRGSWVVSSQATNSEFSAVAYYFARDLQPSIGVPVGLIVSAWGGTIAEAWTSADTLKTLPDFSQPVAAMAAQVASGELDKPFDERLGEWYAKNDPGTQAEPGWQTPSVDTSDWKTETLPQEWKGDLDSFDGIVWYRKEIDLPASWAGRNAVVHLGKVDDADTVWINGRFVGRTNDWNVERAYVVPADVLVPGKNVIALRVLDVGYRGGVFADQGGMRLQASGADAPEAIPLDGPWQSRVGVSLRDARTLVPDQGSPNVPTVLYNGMLAPLTKFPIKGATWYQGESNQDRAKQYETLFPALIADWRQKWNQPELPFLFVQIAPFNGMRPMIREAQRLTLESSPRTGMAVTVDCGDPRDIHPTNKAPVGARLALAARAIAYGEPIEYSGPLFAGLRVEGKRAVVSFKHVGNGLVAAGGQLRGFEIAGEDGQFVPATATIASDTVVVQSPAVAKPVAVRYGWANVPDVNLYNAAGLPASPFQSTRD